MDKSGSVAHHSGLGCNLVEEALLMNDTHKEGAGAGRHRRPCPACKVGRLRRIKRQGWATWLPSSKAYSCTDCRTEFLRLFDSFQFKLKMSGGKSNRTKRELAIVVGAIIVTAYISYRIVIYLYDLGVQHVEQ